MTTDKKLKTVDSKMTLAEYVIFTRSGEMTIEKANKIKRTIIETSGEAIRFKQGKGITQKEKTPYMKPEYWEVAFKTVESES